jgi:pimeloyl-ACP methyl ester carboxylesterase
MTSECKRACILRRSLRPRDQIVLAKAVQRPISIRCIQEAAPEPAWKDKPSWFLIAEEDRTINPKTQHCMVQRMRAETQALPVDHTQLLTAPEVVAEITMTAARAV